jgi:hypothetical protein
MATNLNDGLQHWPGGAVRISMPAAVANDLDTFKKGIAAFAEQLGCPECFSGFDCKFESERDFVLDPDLNVKPTAVRAGQAVSRGAVQRDITIALSPSAEYDLKTILATIDIWGRRLGAHWMQGGQAMCCSGFDVTFERQMQYIVDVNRNVTP